jgi:predicted transcriptional regulator
MAILKSAPKPPKNESLQLRVEIEIKTRLSQYAEFIDSAESYVVTEALKRLFNKDCAFEAWLEQRGADRGDPSLQSAAANDPKTQESTRNGLFK